MATLEECEAAVRGLVDRLADVDPEVRGRYVVQRTLACRVPDLGVVVLARLDDDGLQDVRWEQSDGKPDAQVRLTADSDDLVAIIEGRTAVPTAWATGRLKVDASVLDLLKLRTLL